MHVVFAMCTHGTRPHDAHPFHAHTRRSNLSFEEMERETTDLYTRVLVAPRREEMTLEEDAASYRALERGTPPATPPPPGVVESDAVPLGDDGRCGGGDGGDLECGGWSEH